MVLGSSKRRRWNVEKFTAPADVIRLGREGNVDRYAQRTPTRPTTPRSPFTPSHCPRTPELIREPSDHREQKSVLSGNRGNERNVTVEFEEYHKSASKVRSILKPVDCAAFVLRRRSDCTKRRSPLKHRNIIDPDNDFTDEEDEIETTTNVNPWLADDFPGCSTPTNQTSNRKVSRTHLPSYARSAHQSRTVKRSSRFDSGYRQTVSERVKMNSRTPTRRAPSPCTPRTPRTPRATDRSRSSRRDSAHRHTRRRLDDESSSLDSPRKRKRVQSYTGAGDHSVNEIVYEFTIFHRDRRVNEERCRRGFNKAWKEWTNWMRERKEIFDKCNEYALDRCQQLASNRSREKSRKHSSSSVSSADRIPNKVEKHKKQQENNHRERSSLRKSQRCDESSSKRTESHSLDGHIEKEQHRERSRGDASERRKRNEMKRNHFLEQAKRAASLTREPSSERSAILSNVDESNVPQQSTEQERIATDENTNNRENASSERAAPEEDVACAALTAHQVTSEPIVNTDLVLRDPRRVSRRLLHGSSEIARPVIRVIQNWKTNEATTVVASSSDGAASTALQTENIADDSSHCASKSVADCAPTVVPTVQAPVHIINDPETPGAVEESQRSASIVDSIVGLCANSRGTENSARTMPQITFEPSCVIASTGAMANPLYYPSSSIDEVSATTSAVLEGSLNSATKSNDTLLSRCCRLCRAHGEMNSVHLRACCPWNQCVCVQCAKIRESDSRRNRNISKSSSTLSINESANKTLSSTSTGSASTQSVITQERNLDSVLHQDGSILESLLATHLTQQSMQTAMVSSNASVSAQQHHVEPDNLFELTSDFRAAIVPVSMSSLSHSSSLPVSSQSSAPTTVHLTTNNTNRHEHHHYQLLPSPTPPMLLDQSQSPVANMLPPTKQLAPPPRSSACVTNSTSSALSGNVTSVSRSLSQPNSSASYTSRAQSNSFVARADVCSEVLLTPSSYIINRSNPMARANNAPYRHPIASPAQNLPQNGQQPSLYRMPPPYWLRNITIPQRTTGNNSLHLGEPSVPCQFEIRPPVIHPRGQAEMSSLAQPLSIQPFMQSMIPHSQFTVPPQNRQQFYPPNLMLPSLAQCSFNFR